MSKWDGGGAGFDSEAGSGLPPPFSAGNRTNEELLTRIPRECALISWYERREIMGLIDNIKSLFGSKQLNVSWRFRQLGDALQGDTSQVLRVVDRKTDEEFALKVVDPMKIKEFESRFAKIPKPSEAEICMSLHHPLMPETSEHGETMAEEPYLLMEYIDGMTMEKMYKFYNDRLEGHRVELLRQAAEAVAALHELGYLHRDICPENFVVANDGQSLKLVDFGNSVPAEPKFLDPGNRLIRSAYAGPELLKRGQLGNHRLDIFAFGVTAYQLLTRRIPWSGDESTSIARALRTATEIRQYRPNINMDLARLVMSCLASDPDERPDSMLEVMQRLQQIDHEETSPAPAAEDASDS